MSTSTRVDVGRFIDVWNSAGTAREAARIVGMNRSTASKWAFQLRQQGYELRIYAKGPPKNYHKPVPEKIPVEPFFSPGSMDAIARGCLCLSPLHVQKECPLHAYYYDDYAILFAPSTQEVKERDHLRSGEADTLREWRSLDEGENFD